MFLKTLENFLENYCKISKIQMGVKKMKLMGYIDKVLVYFKDVRVQEKTQSFLKKNGRIQNNKIMDIQ